MDKKQAMAEISALIEEAGKAYDQILAKAKNIADKHAIIFYAGEYGLDGRYYVPKTTPEKIVKAAMEEGSLEYFLGSNDSAETYAGEWISSSSLC